MLTISRLKGDSYSYTENERNKYTRAKVSYFEQAKGNTVNVLSGKEGAVKTLQKQYPNQA